MDQIISHPYIDASVIFATICISVLVLLHIYKHLYSTITALEGHSYLEKLSWTMLKSGITKSCLKLNRPTLQICTFVRLGTTVIKRFPSSMMQWSVDTRSLQYRKKGSEIPYTYVIIQILMLLLKNRAFFIHGGPAG